MPVIKSAIKKLRKDRKLEIHNNSFRELLDRAVRNAKKEKSSDSLTKAFSLIDKASKKNLFHKNKAARMKSGLSKLISAVQSSKSSKKTAAAV